MPRGPSTKIRATRAQRDTLIWILATKEGLTQPEIAERVGVNQSTVSRTLERMTAHALEGLDTMIRQEVALQYARLYAMYQEAIAAWEESKQPRKKVTSRKLETEGRRGQEEGTETEAITEVEDRYGDARMLAEARHILADLRKLLKLQETAPAIFHIEMNWVNQVNQMLRDGEVTEADIIESFGEDLADEFFASNGANNGDQLRIGSPTEEGEKTRP